MLEAVIIASALVLLATAQVVRWQQKKIYLQLKELRDLEIENKKAFRTYCLTPINRRRPPEAHG